MIEIDALTKRYGGQTVVDGVSMMLPAGSITVIVGTSGSGKSTLLKMVNRLVEPSEGRVLIEGRDTRDVPAATLRRRIGYVIQDHGLFPHWTVRRNIATVPALLGWKHEDIESRVDELMRLLQLDPAEMGPRYPHQLSGGQAQRVGVARALAARPDVLLMDEPFGALDPVIRHQAQVDLRAIQQQLGSTILLVTHDMDEAIGLCDRIAVMREGRFDQIGTPTELISRPATDFVRELIGEKDRAFRLMSLLPISDLVRPGEAEGPPIAETASLSQALGEMIWTGRDALPVIDADGNVSGTVERDAVLAAGRPGEDT